MKKNMVKRLLAVLVGAAMVLSLTACGGKTDNQGGADGADAQASAALTEEEYQQAAENLATELAAIQTEVSKLDWNDTEAAKSALEELKKPLNNFMLVTPPTSYEAGHEKMKSGCQALIDFVDVTISIVGETDQAKLEAGSVRMQELIAASVNDMAEGAALLEQATK